MSRVTRMVCTIYADDSYLAVWISKARLHENVVGSGGIYPRILALGTTWRGVNRVRTLTTFLQRKTWVTNCVGCWMNTRASADYLGKRNICCLSRESNPGSSVDQSIVQLLYQLSYPGLYPHEGDGKNCWWLSHCWRNIRMSQVAWWWTV
jgi:hypothetical protein